MRRRLSIPHAVIRSRCFSLLSPTSRYDERGGVCGASRCLPDGAEDGACGLIVIIMYSFRCLPHVCLGSLAAVPPSASTPLVYSRMAFPHDALTRPFSSCPLVHIAPPIDTRDGEPSGAICLLGVADRMMCVGLKKRAGISFPVRLLRLYRLYKP